MNAWAWQGREEGNEERRERVYRFFNSLGENGSNPTMAVAATAASDQQLQQTANVSDKEKERETSIASNDIGNGSGKESPHLHEESDLPESLEHNVPDSPFASRKAAVDFFDDKLAIIG